MENNPVKTQTHTRAYPGNQFKDVFTIEITCTSLPSHHDLYRHMAIVTVTSTNL